MRKTFVRYLPALICLSLRAAPLGVFEDHADVGTVLHTGSVEYDASAGTYTVSGSGENMWFAADAFQFAWKKVSGDVTLTADISFLGTGKEGHRKAVLMIRQSLDGDSAYADVARHGDGLTSLQARDEKGAITSEVQAAVQAPARLRITKHGDYFYISVAAAGEEPRFAGGSLRVPIHDPFYVGIGVCSHNKDVVEKAVFSNVELTAGVATQPVLYSTLETVPVSGDRRAVYVTRGRITAPQWTPDGAALIFQRNGRTERIAIAGGKPEIVASTAEPATGVARISPDGQQLAFLASAGGPDMLLRILSLKDNKVRVVAKLPAEPAAVDPPSWSPDSRRLAFVSYHLVPRANDDWGPLEFLIGKWTGEGNGQPGAGVGSFSLLPDLQGKVLVRKSFAEYAGSRHDDLTIVFRQPDTGDLQATYYDSEGHSIGYAVRPVEGGVEFLSEGPPSEIRYRLTYLADGKDRARLTFEIAPPGKEFVKYLDAALRRQP